MRLIDADALKEMKFSGGMHDDNWIVYVPLREVVENIDKAPTVDLLDTLRAAGWKEDGWISVNDKDKLPEGECIAYSSKFHEMVIGYIGETQDSDTGYLAENEGEVLYDVNHWMPKPEPPQERSAT